MLSFCYNGYNQLANVQDADGRLTVYSYNGNGLRTAKQTADETTNFYYDANANIILETDEFNTVTAKNVRGLHLISRENAGEDPFYYLYNAHGDVTKLVDELGNVLTDYSYDPFGNQKEQLLSAVGGNLSLSQWQAETQQINNPFRYCGEYLDSETGNYYLRARYYDPAVQRFISEDAYKGKLTNPLTLNLYTYCENNPVNRVDPSGNNAVASLRLATGAVIGATVQIRIMATIVYHDIRNAAANLSLLAKSKGKENQKDSGLSGLSNEQIAKRLQDKNISSKEKLKLQKEQKARKTRNKQKRNGYGNSR